MCVSHHASPLDQMPKFLGKKGMNKVSAGKKKSWCPHTNGDETGRDVILTRMYERANGEGLSLFPGLFFCGIIRAFDLFFCLLRPLSHNTLSSSDAFIMWYFVSFCLLPRRGFHFYAAVVLYYYNKASGPVWSTQACACAQSVLHWQTFGEQISLTAPKQYRFGN